MLSDIIYHLILLNSLRSDKKEYVSIYVLYHYSQVYPYVATTKKDTCLQEKRIRVHRGLIRAYISPTSFKRKSANQTLSVIWTLTIFTYCTLYHYYQSFRVLQLLYFVLYVIQLLYLLYFVLLLLFTQCHCDTYYCYVCIINCISPIKKTY